MSHRLTCPSCGKKFTGYLTVGTRVPCGGCGTALIVRLEIALG